MKREHILQEIKRTAKANGGAPLGMSKFADEIGIRESDWLGTHWARWGDAVREAGLTPNQMKTSYDESLLMEKYIALMRELGKLPVRTEMKLKRRSDPNFPDPLTFGSKLELVKRVAAYCQNRAGYEDVLSLCGEYIPPRSTKSAQIADAVDGEIGFVYLMKSGKFFKLGRKQRSRSQRIRTRNSTP